MTLNFNFTDYFRLTQPSDQQVEEWKDYLGGMTASQGLRIIMEATHAAYLNRNDRVYIPSRMAEGVSTFRTGEKPTKLLKHHRPDEDPVGVIRGARFVPTVPDELAYNPDVINLMSSSAPIKDQLKSMRNLWRSGVFHQEGWRGLGYIELIGDVYDKTTIEQIQDGRFDAVSTSFRSPGHVYCFICGQNWAKDGYCDHDHSELYTEDGAEEDDMKFPAMAIAGLHDYIETSFITFEGDALATVKVMDEANADNNITFFLPDTWKEEPTTCEPTFEFKDFKEDDMAKPATKDEITLSDAEQKVLDIIKKLRADAKDEDLIPLAQKIVVLRDEEGFLPFQQEAEIDEETAIQYALEDLETSDQEVDADAVYMEMEKELDELDLADAKLSTKTRKGLPSSAFCGPDRSFPVPDCAHVTAARRLIGRYKGPGNKSSILACVSRKAKSLGCNSSDSGEEQGTNNDSTNTNLLPCEENSLKNMEDNDLRNVYMAAELELVSRGQKMAFECKECALHEEKVKKAEKSVAKAEAKVEKLNDTLGILREELQRAYADYAAQVDITVEAKASLHAEQVENLALIGVLNKKYDTLDAAKVEIKDKDLGKLGEAIKDGFDLESVTAKLNDGMAREPEGIVKDPTVNPDGDNPRLPEELTGPALMAIDNIKELVSDGKISDAKHIYATMKKLKLFHDELTFESLSVEDENTTE
jgi:hypothetical protein